jgi:glyoxylase-like metal-dependent hydrolase (beta-lactamase superfamily II)
MMDKSGVISSSHFMLEQLSEGVYAAINSAAGWAICNAGIIDLGDHTLVYDAFMTPGAASDLRYAAESLTGRPVHVLVNSHYHNDHIWGNQAFSADTEIVSTAETRQLIINEGPKEIKAFGEVIQDRLSALEKRLASTQDEVELVNAKLTHTYFQGIAATLPILQLRLPTLTFTGKLVWDGSKRSAWLLSYEGGHCANDAILYLPQDGIVFMEDLLFSGFHPYIEECDPIKLAQIFAEIKNLAATTFVPGHGPVAKASQLDWMLDYIDCLDALAGEVINQGGTEDDLDKVIMPRDYDSLLFPQFFPASLRFMYKRRINR